jgi:hypothetical protein
MLVDDSISDCAFAKFTVKKHVVNNKKISVVLNVFSLNFFALFLKNKMMKKLVAKTKSSIETLSSGITEECEVVGVGVDVGIGDCEVVGVGVGSGVGSGFGDGVGVGLAVGFGVAVSVGSGVGVGVADGVALGVDEGVGVRVAVGVDVGIGDCEGNIQSGLTCQSLAATVKGRKSNIKIVAINNVFFMVIHVTD